MTFGLQPFREKFFIDCDLQILFKDQVINFHGKLKFAIANSLIMKIFGRLIPGNVLK